MASFERSCIACGAPLYGSFELVFCSHGCEMELKYARRALQKARRRRGFVCRHCGGTFDATTRADQKYCSETCRSQASKARTGYDAGRDLATEHCCIWCGEAFRRYVPPSKPKPKFCTNSCQHRWRHAQKGTGPRSIRAASAEAQGKTGCGVGD
jgi:hypothetical protein